MVGYRQSSPQRPLRPQRFDSRLLIKKTAEDAEDAEEQPDRK